MQQKMENEITNLMIIEDKKIINPNMEYLDE
jgi:hypothetical protein